MDVTAKSTTEVTVLIGPSPDSPDVAFYTASIGPNACNVTTLTLPLKCDISGLKPGAPQAVLVVACVRSGDCGASTSGQGVTLPEGNCSNSIIHFEFNSYNTFFYEITLFTLLI